MIFLIGFWEVKLDSFTPFGWHCLAHGLDSHEVHALLKLFSQMSALLGCLLLIHFGFRIFTKGVDYVR